MDWGLAQYSFTVLYYYVQKSGTAAGKERAVYRSFLELLVLLVQAKRTYRKIKNVKKGAVYCMHKEGAGFMQYSPLTFICLDAKKVSKEKSRRTDASGRSPGQRLSIHKHWFLFLRSSHLTHIP
jgi:hypothetical protein